MTSKELLVIKNRIEHTLKQRSGNGDVSMYTGDEYRLPVTSLDAPLSADVGKNTVDLLLKVVGDYPDRENFPELGTGTYSGGAIPDVFNEADISHICDVLDADVDSPDRGGFRGYGPDGVYYDLPGGRGGMVNANNRTEVNHCGGVCTGLCVGSCIGMCNGCVGCSSSCGSADAVGSINSTNSVDNICDAHS